MLLHFNAMLLLLVSLMTRVSAVKVNVLEFNQEKYNNYAKGNKANFKMGSEMKSSKVSVCFRFQPRYDESIALFHRNHHLQFNLVTLKNGFGFVKINRVGRMFDLKMKNFDLFKWHHFCFTVHQKKEKSEQHVQVNIDGKTLIDTVYKDDNLKPITLERKMGLGGSHEGASVEWGLFGKVADLNIWTRILTQSEIQSFTDIKVNPTGCNDISQSDSDLWLDWNSLFASGNFTLGSKTIHVSEESKLVCSDSEKLGRAIFAIEKSFEDARTFCSSLNGHLIRDAYDVSHWKANTSWIPKGYETAFIGDPSSCGRVWIDYRKLGKRKNGLLQLQNSLGEIKGEDELAWKHGYPNGNEKKKCLYIKHDEYQVRDGPCSHKYCFACEMPAYSKYLLRGYRGDRESLQENEFGLSLGLQKDKKTELRFEGLTRGKIKWDLETGEAQLEFNEDKGDTYFKSMGNFAFGLTKWSKHTGDFKNTKQKVLAFEAKFTKCDSETHFTCNSGECIDIAKRCDEDSDCPDESDEWNSLCQIAYTNPKTYEMSNVPLPPGEGGKTERLNVKVGFNVFEIDNINTRQLEYNLAFQVSLFWYEYRMMHYVNLKEKSSDNLLPPTVASNLWIPPLEFKNTIARAVIKYDESEGSFLKVKRNKTDAALAQTTYIGQEHLHEGIAYSADENILHMISNQRLVFKCSYNLTYYPFDSQKCNVELSVPDLLTSRLNLTLGNLVSSNLEVPPEYQVVDVTLLLVDSQKILMTIEVRRLSGIYFLTLFIPSLCLITAASLTLFIGKIHFEVNIQVALTSTLVMYTLSGSVSDELPDTGSIKMVDVWMIHGLINPFVVFLALVSSRLMDRRKEIHGGEEAKQKFSNFDRLCQIAIPTFTLVFTLAFFAIATSQ